MRARPVCRVPDIDSIPTGRPPMRSNASPERAAALLAASLLEAAWISLVYVLVESLTRSAEPPLSMFAFAGAALAGIAFARLRRAVDASTAPRWPRWRSPWR